MPGDRVVAKMYLEKRSESGVTLSVSFYRREDSGKEIKLAQGVHEAVWHERRGGTWSPAPLPFAGLPTNP